jgi:cellobiose phosphorylase
VQATGDTGLLEERTPFLTARSLHADEEANYDLPQTSDDIASMYEHATRAIDHALRFGIHGLPLMGCGDWNDGMNLVGQHGKGESVWLAFFLYDTLNQFAELARQRSDIPTADRYSVEAGRLRGNIEQSCWDGQWYRRAYFDDGTPLGSSENEECQIDSISQCWAVLSGAGPRERTLVAMESVNRRLVRRADGLIQLLDPPFDKSDLNPGYIKGYVPGVRENGGQYTHAAIWTAMAFAELGETERAWEMFDLMNPITHGSTPQSIATYRVEPYVVAADVYGVAPHVGRGGWTWYTGSAGWMYRLVTESLLGLYLESNTLRFAPHAPQRWPSYKIHYRFHQSQYHITITNSGKGSSIKSLAIDGILQTEFSVPLINDGKDHDVAIALE